MTEVVINPTLLRESFGLAVERESQITGRFYEILFSRYPQVQRLFGRNSTVNQQKMLQEALIAVVEHLEDAEWLEGTLGRMGREHIAYEVTEEMYLWVQESLVATLAELLADDWTVEHEQQWNAVLSRVSALMIAGSRAATASA